MMLNSIQIFFEHIKLFSPSSGGQNKHGSEPDVYTPLAPQGRGQERFQRKQFLPTNIFKITFNTIFKDSNYFRIPLHVWQNRARHRTRYLWQLPKVDFFLNFQVIIAVSFKINQKFPLAEICYWYCRLLKLMIQFKTFSVIIQLLFRTPSKSWILSHPWC